MAGSGNGKGGITIPASVLGIVVAIITQVVGFAFAYGVLTSRVDNLAQQVADDRARNEAWLTRIESKLDQLILEQGNQ